MKMYVAWNAVSAFILGYLIYFHNIIPVLIKFDPTFICFTIFSIYVTLTVYMGIKGKNSNFKAIQFVASNFPYLGLIGTILGLSALVIMMSTVDPANTALYTSKLLWGFGHVLGPTGFGIGAFLLTRAQAWACFRVYDE